MSPLTPEQLKKRKKSNRKILLYVVLPLFVIILLCGLCGKDKPVAGESGNQPYIDSLVAAMKTDTTYQVKAVLFEDSTFKIAVSNPNPDVAGHFNIHYGLGLTYALDPMDANDALTRSRGITGIAVYQDTISKETVVKEFGSHFVHH